MKYLIIIKKIENKIIVFKWIFFFKFDFIQLFEFKPILKYKICKLYYSFTKLFNFINIKKLLIYFFSFNNVQFYKYSFSVNITQYTITHLMSVVWILKRLKSNKQQSSFPLNLKHLEIYWTPDLLLPLNKLQHRWIIRG